MKFKVGDKVKHKDFGLGKIIYIDEEMTAMPYAVQFKIFNNEMWCEEGNLELYTQQSKNLIPEIAKMLGVEIGEEFMLDQEENQYTYRFVENGVEYYKDDEWRVDKLAFHSIVSGILKVKKLPPKPKPILTEDEKAVLRNLPKQYKWIARDKHEDNLCVFLDKPRKRQGLGLRQWVALNPSRFDLFSHLFQFIKWEDATPYNIEELLKE
jgi:hypothetical protein